MTIALKSTSNASLKGVTRATGFSSATFDVGFVGFGIMPEELQRAQKDYWKYQPWQVGAAQSK